MSSSHSNDSNIDCESAKSDDENTSFNQCLSETGRGKEHSEIEINNEMNTGLELKSNFRPIHQINNEFSLNCGASNLSVNPSQKDTHTLLNFQSSLTNQQLKMLNQFYNDLRSGSCSPGLANFLSTNHLTQFGNGQLANDFFKHATGFTALNETSIQPSTFASGKSNDLPN